MTTTLKRSVFVNAVKQATDDPRLIETAETQDYFVVSGWSGVTPDGTKPCGCVVGEFLMSHGVDYRVERSWSSDRLVALAVKDSISDAMDKVRLLTGVNLTGIGISIDKAVKRALDQAGEYSHGVIQIVED